jgi:hypothetical protein
MEGQELRNPAENTQRQSSGLAGLFGWFASSLGVIGAILYACGYLISAAQLHLLGLGRLMTYGHDYYIQEGGRFLADISSTVALGALDFSVILIPLAMLAVGAAILWRNIRLRHAPWISSLHRCSARVREMWRYAAYAVLLILLLYSYGDPMEFGLPLTLSNVLFTNPAASAPSTQATIRALLLHGDRNGLAAIFEGRLLTYIAVCLLLLGSQYLTSAWKWRRLAAAPFVLLFTLYSLLLPMLYGVLKSQVEFPVVVIRPGGDPKSTEGQRGFLLNLDEHEAVLYVSVEHKVLWRRTEQIDGLDVIGMAPILKEVATPKGIP